jgi:competence protein ComEA
LEPYIVVDGQNGKPYSLKPEQGIGNETRNAEEYEKGNSERTYTKPFVAERKPVLQPFDINTVDTTQLVRLKGIGSKLAGRIVKFRDALGGFVSTDQYADIFGLDSLALSELQHFGKIQSPPHKININTASVEELDKHVYVSRRQAEIIIRYREQHGAFASLEALKPIRVLDAKTIEKLGPYLSFE